MENETLTTVTTTYDAWSSVLFAVLEPVLILLLGVLLARFVEKTIVKVFGTLRLDEKASVLLRRKFSVSSLLSSSATFVIYVGTVVLALSRLGVLFDVIRWTGLILVGAGCVAALLRLWDLVVNVYASRDVDVQVGDTFSVGCVEGRVEKRGWLSVVVDDGGRSVIVPNRYIRRQL
jgi:small-conductance mechanosensitive channel